MAVFTDDFDRANAASLGVNWTEVGVNAFRISTNRSLGLTNKINFTHPAALSPVAGMYVQVEIYDVGAVAHGIGCMLSAWNQAGIAILAIRNNGGKRNA